MFARVAHSSLRVKHALLCVGVLVVVALLSGSSSATVEMATPGISVFHFANYTWPTSSLPQYGSVVTGDPSLRSQIKSASPSTLVLNYKEAMGLQDNCGSNTDTCSTAITFQQAQAHDASFPGDPWILRDSSGNPIPNRSYADIYLANVGSASYQQQWAANVISADKGNGFDGTAMDNVLANVSWWAPAGVFPTLYPSDSAWQSAMTSFMAYVGPHLKAQGLYVRASAGEKSGSAAYVSWWKTLAPDVSGLEVEYFEQAGADFSLYYNDPSDWHGDWSGWLSLVDVAQNAGDDFYGGMQGGSTDTGKMMYGKASFLLKWNGKGGGFYWQAAPSVDPWNPAWTTDIGQPLGPMYAVGAGWRRDYSGGTVLVNPTCPVADSACTPQTITFNLGGNYVTPGGSTVSSVTLGPVSAMILTGTSSTTTTTSAASGAPVDQTLPAISPLLNVPVGTTLSAAHGSWSNTPTGYSYQWKRCDSAGNNCAAISGALSNSYLLVSADVGSTIRVTVTASNSSGSGVATSDPTAVVTGGTTTTTTTTTVVTAPVNLTAPTISGTPVVGQTLTVNPGSWTGNPTFSYQWIACNNGGNSCSNIPGATGARYVLSTADLSTTLQVDVFATNSAGTTVVRTPSTQRVTGK